MKGLKHDFFPMHILLWRMDNGHGNKTRMGRELTDSIGQIALTDDLRNARNDVDKKDNEPPKTSSLNTLEHS